MNSAGKVVNGYIINSVHEIVIVMILAQPAGFGDDEEFAVGDIGERKIAILIATRCAGGGVEGFRADEPDLGLSAIHTVRGIDRAVFTVIQLVELPGPLPRIAGHWHQTNHLPGATDYRAVR